MSRQPLDMTPKDMAEALAEREFLSLSMEEILSTLCEVVGAKWSHMAAEHPKAVEVAYLDMVGALGPEEETDDEV